MSSRVLVLTLIASLGSYSVALAEESISQSASRIVRESAASSGETAVRGATVASRAANWVNPVSSQQANAVLAQNAPVLSKSGMKKRTKVMIYLAAGVGFAASAYAIDHHVVDVTPSSLGTRKD